MLESKEKVNLGCLKCVVEENYALKIDELSHFHTGSNETFLIISNGKRFFLRESNYRWSQSHLDIELQCLDRLSSFGYTPVFRKLINGDNYLFLDGNFYVLFESIEGDHDVPGNIPCKVGEFIFKFHNDLDSVLGSVDIGSRFILDSYLNNHFLERSISKYYNYSEVLSCNYDFNFFEVANGIDNVLCRLYEECNISFLEDLDIGVIHNDISLLNLIFDRNQIKGLLDFEYINVRERFYEIAWTFTTICSDCGIYNLNSILDLLKSYLESRGEGLSESELALLPIFNELAVLASIRWSINQYVEYGILRSRNFSNNLKLTSQFSLVRELLSDNSYDLIER